MAVVEIRGMTKRYGRLLAVNDLSLTVEEGEVFALLGPNGAGKTTTMSVLMGFIFPTVGSIRIFGQDMTDEGRETRRRIGFMPEELGLYDSLTGYEHLEFYGRLFGMEKREREEKIHDMLQLVGLTDRKDSLVREYSHGMRQRLGVAQALINEPDLLILDEPTSGLDPRASHEVREIIKSLAARHITLILSSHLLHEVEQVCDTVAIINKGKLIRKDTIKDLVRETRDKGIRVSVTCLTLNRNIIDAVRGISGVEHVETRDNILTAIVRNEELAADINTAVVKAGGRVVRVEESTPDLEEIFLQLTEGD
ncbi:MAG TPA: ABC transporter ATP-binding protein [Thermoplasmatales archaeon]|nr:ABC transporter ATP-binding protein [Candidatus Thermoplasmatota archaeon]MDD5777867.1 ABC transporter ATP-binding protein [Candidatus Thermoplasmatota archaeon]HDS58855.1 ABC transporter ATP-binding protein [Thermoplasmatales archaeon]